MTDKNELIHIKTKSVLAAFSTGDGLDRVISDAKAIVDAHEPNLKTDKGRKAIASLAHKVSKLKVKLDDTGKNLVADWKSKSKAVDASRRHLRDELDKLRDLARQPLTDWEDVEELRKQAHKDVVSRINMYALYGANGDLHSLAGLLKNLSDLKLIIPDESFEEFELEARKAKEYALPKLQKLIDDKKASIAKDKELQQLREADAMRKQRERDEKLKHDAAESARIEAEKKAQQEIAWIQNEKEAAIQAQKYAEADKNAAIKAVANAEIKAKEKAEQDAKDRKRQEQAAQEKREANKRHVGKIRDESKADIMDIIAISMMAANDAITDADVEKVAKKIILAIDAGDIPHIKIEY